METNLACQHRSQAMLVIIDIYPGLKDLWPDNLIGLAAPQRK